MCLTWTIVYTCTPYHCFLEISSRYIHSLIKNVHIVNAELIESTLKQTIMCSCFNDLLMLWLSKYKKYCVHLILDHLNLATTILVYEYCGQLYEYCPQLYSYKKIYEYCTILVSSNNKTLNARLLARVITGCHYT